MRIISPGAIQELAGAIALALSTTSDEHRRPKPLGTIDPAHLYSVALGALTAACGDVVWPDGTVVKKHPDEQLSFVENDYSMARRR